MAAISVEVEWALRSERPGAREDYTVLSCSGGRLRPSHFEKIITRFSPGTPESEWFLPRVTISAVDIERRPYVGMAIQEPSDQYDGTGRRIAPTRFFLFPYESLDRPASYRSLYGALSRLELPETGDGLPFVITVPELDADGIAADLALLGRDSALVTAGCLLDKVRVCVTQAEQTKFEERLRYLDAAAALLPYGYRAKLTATTWANSATRHNLRLYFARRSADAETLSLPWQEPVEARLHGTYAAHLRQLLDDYEPAQVIAMLAGETEVRRFDDPGAASETLAVIWDRLYRRRTLRHHEPTLEELRAWLDDDGLDPADAEDCLRKLVQQARGEDLDRVIRWLPRVTGIDGLEPWLRSLTAMAARLLWFEGVRLHGLLRLIPREQDADAFLAELIRNRPRQTAEFGVHLASAAQLLIAGIGHNPAAHPRTGQVLAADVPATLTLISELTGGERDERAENALGWACDLLPGELRPLIGRLAGVSRPPAGSPQWQVTPEEIARLAHPDPLCLQLALGVASHTGMLQFMALPFVQWVFSRGGFTPDESQSWGGVLSGLDLEEPSSQAAVDVVLLTTGHRPRWIMEVPPGFWETYRRHFAHLWNQHWPDRRQMSLALAGHLRHQPWHDVPGRADQILRLLDALTLEEAPALDGALIESLSRAEDLSDNPHARQWLAHRSPPGGGRQGVPATAAAPTAQVRTPAAWPPSADDAARPATSPGRAEDPAQAVIAYILARMTEGYTAPEIYGRLAERRMLTGAGVAVAVVERLPRALSPHKSLNEARTWSNDLIDRLCGGEFGPQLAAEFGQFYLTKILDRINDDINLIKRLDHACEGLLGNGDNTERIRTRAEVLKTIAAQRRPKPGGHRKPGAQRKIPVPFRKKGETEEPGQAPRPGAEPEAR